MKIKFWAVNLNMGDGSSTNVKFQTKKQAQTAVENNNESQGEGWGDIVYADCIEIADNKIVLSEDANYYLTEILED